MFFSELRLMLELVIDTVRPLVNSRNAHNLQLLLCTRSRTRILAFHSNLPRNNVSSMAKGYFFIMYIQKNMTSRASLLKTSFSQAFWQFFNNQEEIPQNEDEIADDEKSRRLEEENRRLKRERDQIATREAEVERKYRRLLIKVPIFLF